tara:strand:- start:2090 stop:2362 length:273 start_codon:yes stop_codon:yes gene_type:complete
MFKPVNRHILLDVQSSETESAESLIVLPDDYNPEPEKFIKARAMRFAEDIRFKLKEGTAVIVDSSMIEQITVDGSTYNVILDNYIMGILE